MSCTTPRILNSDVINFKRAHSVSETAQWIVSHSDNFNPTSIRVAIRRLWSEYEKFRKNKSKSEGSRKLTEFLETEFAPPKVSNTVTPKMPEATYLISSSGDAFSTAMSISNSVFMENQNLTNEKIALKSELTETISHMQTLNIKSEDVIKQNRVLHEKLKSSNQAVKRTKRREDYWKTKCTKLETSDDTSKEDYQALLNELQAENDQLRVTVNDLQHTLKEKDDEISYLVEQLHNLTDNKVINLFDKKEKAFTPELHLCVYSLLEHNVPSTKIGPTIETCLKLAGKEPDRLPSPSTVVNMNIQRLCLAKKQLQEELSEKINTTLHTDETSKFGIKYGGFSVRDEEGNYFALGLREMATKSAQNTLDTFKEILQDISDNSEETQKNIGNKVICNIQNTMSDRAPTELKFNELLESYREELLPQIREDYHALDDVEKETVSRLNNFFCGIHGLVHMANEAQKGLCEAEKGNFDGNPPIFDENFSKIDESGCFRLIRSACKAFARRGDEKCGCYGAFRTFFTENRMISLPLQPFKGHRFNILFQNAACLYFLHPHMTEFLEKSDIENKRLLKSVLSDLKVSFYVAGLKALGLISKMTTTPLWNILENKDTSIEDMTQNYLHLSTYLADVTENLADFIKGTFPALTGIDFNGDRVFEFLTKESNYDTDVEIILRVLLPAIRKVVLHVYKDHLPDGKYETFTEELSLATKSVDKYNSYSERLFAYMDQILRAKPNISALALEAYTLFLMNKTSTWIIRNKEDMEDLISEARKSVSTERDLFSKRKGEIQRQREEKQEEEFRKRAEKKRRKQVQLEKQSDDIIFYGLWKSARECKLRIKEYGRTSDKVNALKAQLRYRKNVLKQNVLEQKLFSFSRKSHDGKRQTLTHKELLSNLLKVLKSV
ncbi:uncharacterized protein LOC134281055 [Saccostrea cucullata]|uniref:uncharacterized protein LOC134281055 n=1 Tax=Saccostrea cuccullata TaxID=36930 RepID=UPI002ED28AAA